MAGGLLHPGAVVLCAHGAPASPATTNPRVLVNGLPTALLLIPWPITGCPATLPCVLGVWSAGTTRVLSNGQPLCVLTGAGISIPNGTPLNPISAQGRVTAV
jgi:hypothetical protein